MTIETLAKTARGDRPADLLLRKAKVVNVFTAETLDRDVAVTDGHIAGFGAREARQEIDLKGRYLAPGFIDAHVLIESAMASPVEFARAVLPWGTTSVMADPHEIANVLGMAGIDYMLQAAEALPLRFCFTLPSCVPATAMETAGAELTADDLAPWLTHPRVVALAEMMNFPGVIHNDPGVLEKIKAAPGAVHASRSGDARFHGARRRSQDARHYHRSGPDRDRPVPAGRHRHRRAGRGRSGP